MANAGKIVIGLVIFLAIVTSPMWYHLVVGAETDPPEIVLPPEGGQCVAEKAYMRSFHMDLLNQWRVDVVRRNDRTHIGPDHKEYEKSLSRTCMKCHSNKDEFCDRCHDYAGVKPYCWSCHVEPGGRS